jgi:hypothetical protein
LTIFTHWERGWVWLGLTIKWRVRKLASWTPNNSNLHWLLYISFEDEKSFFLHSLQEFCENLLIILKNIKKQFMVETAFLILSRYFQL